MGNKSNIGEANANAVLVKGFQVTSIIEVEKNTECDMITGDDMSVMDGAGNVLFTGLRGFMPLGGEDALIRQADGQWVLIRKRRQIKLKKVNLNHEGLALFFDERGKLHYNQSSPYCRSIIA